MDHNDTEGSALTEKVLASLPELEAVIDRGKETFLEVGTALAEIRERKLYREAGFTTFEAYCRGRHGFTAGRGRQYILGAKTATAVTLAGGTPPATEREARALRAGQRAYDTAMTQPELAMEEELAQNELPIALPEMTEADGPKAVLGAEAVS